MIARFAHPVRVCPAPLLALLVILVAAGSWTHHAAAQASTPGDGTENGTSATPQNTSTQNATPQNASPQNADVLVARARQALDNDQAEQARSMAQRAVEMEPGNPGLAWNTLGRAYLELGDCAAAAPAFEAATQADPENAYAWNNLGYAYLLCDHPSKALAPIEKAIALDDEVSYMHNNLGVAYERNGRLEEAHAAYARAVELDSGSMRAMANLERCAALVTARAARAGAATKPASARKNASEEPNRESPVD
ncbi:MAG: tetratricopeptide repeat protein [Candidatus Eiseniibacteriota bacterium]|jgi:Flp pilus assembly protein TadD